MQCPGCSNSPVIGAVPTPDGSQYQPCPLCSQYGTPGQWPGAGSYYPYALNFSLTSQVPTLGTILIRTNLDFLWKYAIATRTGTFTFLIDINGNQLQTVFTQSGAQQSVQSGAGINDTNFWGTQTNPFPLPDPILLPQQTRLNIQVTDTSGANGGAPNNIALFLVGANFQSSSNSNGSSSTH